MLPNLFVLATGVLEAARFNGRFGSNVFSNLTANLHHFKDFVKGI
jgi:hypothetical protein